MHKRLNYCLLLCCLATLFFCGCVAEETEVAGYIPRGASTDKVATLQGGWAVYIDNVDGGDVESAANTTSNFGSNRVRVLGGNHTVSVRIYRSGTEQMGMMQRNWKSEEHFTFSGSFDADHTYLIESANTAKARQLKITDKTTGKSWTIDASAARKPYGFAQQ